MSPVDTIALLPAPGAQVDMRPSDGTESDGAEFRPIAPRQENRGRKETPHAPHEADSEAGAPDDDAAGDPERDPAVPAVPAAFVAAMLASETALASQQAIGPIAASSPAPANPTPALPQQADAPADVAAAKSPEPRAAAPAIGAPPALPAEATPPVPDAQPRQMPRAESSDEPAPPGAAAGTADAPAETPSATIGAAEPDRTTAPVVPSVPKIEAAQKQDIAVEPADAGANAAVTEAIVAPVAARHDADGGRRETAEVQTQPAAPTPETASTDGFGAEPMSPAVAAPSAPRPGRTAANVPTPEPKAPAEAAGDDAVPQSATPETTEGRRDGAEGAAPPAPANHAAAIRPRAPVAAAAPASGKPGDVSGDIRTTADGADGADSRPPAPGATQASSAGSFASPIQVERFAVPGQTQIAVAGQGAAGASPNEQIAVQIAHAVHEGNDRLVVQLRPQSLGRIRIELEVAPDNRVTAVIGVERQETLDLLQRDARGLERALNDAGLKADAGSLSFNLRGDGDQRGHGMADGRSRPLNFVDFDDAPPPAPQTYRVYGRATADGVDIRV